MTHTYELIVTVEEPDRGDDNRLRRMDASSIAGAAISALGFNVTGARAQPASKSISVPA